MSKYTYNTKAYTLNSLISEVAGISTKANLAVLIETLSPRAGSHSAKFAVIMHFLGGGNSLQDVLEGYTFISGVTPRTRLLNALRYRKAQGFFNNY